MQIIQSIQNRIHTIRGQRVMLEEDIAKLYQVDIKVLNLVVKRNIARFPDDFMFQLRKVEWERIKSLRSQIVTLNACRIRELELVP